jgi:hypothetical protein
MSTQVQYRRGTNAQNAAFTGALAEITVDTTNGTLRVHDGINAGGSNIATVSYVTAQISALSANSISSGTSNVRVVSSGGNVTTSVGGTANVLVITSTGANIAGTLNATGNANVGNLGATTVVATTLTGTLSTATQTNITSVGTLGSLSVTGNITGGNLSGTSIVGTLTTASQTNITAVGTLATGTWNATTIATNKGGTGLTSFTTNGAVYATSTSALTTGTLPVASGGTGATTSTGSGAVVLASSPALTTPNIGAATGTSLTVSTGSITCGSIVNANANGVGNIGSSTTYFNTVFAKATSAQYADLAEMYVSDQDYPPGTVVEFGGDKEVTISSVSHSTAVAGIVSTNPSYLMNSTQSGEHVLPIALTGRVPCRVQGPVRKGDVLVASSTPGVAQRIGMNWQPGCVVGKSMEVIDTAEIRTIEVAVGRL